MIKYWPSTSEVVFVCIKVISHHFYQDNFRGGVGVSHLVLNADKARVKSAAKRRLKSGRRAHFILGSNEPSYKTVSEDTFMGKPREDQNIPAAGKVGVAFTYMIIDWLNG